MGNSDGSEHSLENCWYCKVWGSTPHPSAMKWKLLNYKKGKELQITLIDTPTVIINVNYIPRGMAILDYLDFLQKERILLKEGE